MNLSYSGPTTGEAFNMGRQLIRQIKSEAAKRATNYAANGAAADHILGLWRQLNTWKANLALVASAPGIVAYAANQVGDGSFDVTTYIAGITTAIDDCISYIESTMPADANGYLLVISFGAGGNLSYRAFSAASLADLVTKLQTLVEAV